jgi:hypothetical protein
MNLIYLEEIYPIRMNNFYEDNLINHNDHHDRKIPQDISQLLNKNNDEMV